MLTRCKARNLLSQRDIHFKYQWLNETTRSYRSCNNTYTLSSVHYPNLRFKLYTLHVLYTRTLLNIFTIKFWMLWLTIGHSLKSISCASPLLHVIFWWTIAFLLLFTIEIVKTPHSYLVKRTLMMKNFIRPRPHVVSRVKDEFTFVNCYTMTWCCHWLQPVSDKTYNYIL